MPRQDKVNPIEAEVRSIESGLRAYHNGDGTWRVRSSTRPALWWTVGVGAWNSPQGWRLILGCTCEAGRTRPGQPTPCLHAACVGRSLERRGLAVWIEGIWAPTEGLLREALHGTG